MYNNIMKGTLPSVVRKGRQRAPLLFLLSCAAVLLSGQKVYAHVVTTVAATDFEKSTLTNFNASITDAVSVTTQQVSGINVAQSVVSEGISTLLRPAKADATLRSTVIQRKELLKKIAAKDPKAFLDAMLPIDLRGSIPTDLQDDIESKQVLSGTLQVLHVDDFDNPSNSRFDAFVVSGKKKTPLYSVEPVTAQSGVSVSIPVEMLDGIAVVEAFGTDTSNGYTNNLWDGSNAFIPGNTGVQKTLVFLVNFSDSPTPPLTKTQMHERIFSGPFQKFYKEESYNKISFTGTTIGWIRIPTPFPLAPEANNVCGSVELETPEIARALTQNAINLSSYNHVVFVVNHPNALGGCAFVGRIPTAVGAGTANLSFSWVGDVGQINNEIIRNDTGVVVTRFDSVIIHEVGHGLGFYHAHGLDCGERKFGGNDTCSPIEYGNIFDVMGSGLASLHSNGLFKSLFGWITGPETLSITRPGTYTLQALESATATPKFALVHALNSKYKPFSLEFRRAMGFDSNLNTSYASNQKGLFVSSLQSAIPLLGSSESVVESYLLDMRPTANDFLAGGDIYNATLNGSTTFSDRETGITIGPILSVSPTAITFKVGMSEPECAQLTRPSLEGIAYTNPYSPKILDISAGRTVREIAYVKNTDSKLCPGAVFTFSVAGPQSWKATSSPSRFVVEPGVKGPTSVIFTVPTSTARSSFPVTFRAVNTASGLVGTSTVFFRVNTPAILKTPKPATIQFDTQLTLTGSGFVDKLRTVRYTNIANGQTFDGFIFSMTTSTILIATPRASSGAEPGTYKLKVTSDSPLFETNEVTVTLVDSVSKNNSWDLFAGAAQAFSTIWSFLGSLLGMK